MEQGGFVVPAAVEVVEKNAFAGRAMQAGAAAHDDDSSAAAANLVLQLVHQREMADVIDQNLHLHAVSSLQSLEIGDGGIGNDGIERNVQSANGGGCPRNGVEVRKVAGHGNRGGACL